ncbi:MAG: hypothetical protein MI865_04425 [Proteobacteria bacterium]|nr:hypothetical protein [Pseudomonadota bacterium]
MARFDSYISSTSSLFLGCLCLISCNVFADSYESYPVLNSNEILSTEYRSSTYHRVESIELENGFFQFTVESNIGLYHVSSLELLKKRVSEIVIVSQAIDQYEKQNSELSGELRSELHVSGNSAVDIITSPFKTATNLAGQLTDNLDATFAGEDPYLRDRSNDYSLREPQDPTTAAHKRNAAFQLGLDMYSSNSKVQSFLNAVANARAAGRVTAGVGLNNSFNNPLKKNKLDLEIGYLLKTNSSEDLEYHNIQKLIELGISRKLIRSFIDHPVLSPTNKITIVFYLSRLDKVNRLDSFIRFVLTAKNEVMALTFQQLSKVLWYYHTNNEKISSFNMYRGQPAILTASRHLVIFEDADLLIWSEDKEKQYAAFAQHAQKAGYNGWEIVSLGSLSAMSSMQLGELNFQKQTNFLKAL